MKMLYGSHPYGLRGSGEIDTVKALRRDDLMDFYRSQLYGGRCRNSDHGRLSRAEAADIAEAINEGLAKREACQRPAAGEPPIPKIERIPILPRKAIYLLAYPGLRRDDPDYFPLLVGNYILGGGGFTSRLMEEIRQKRGLAYSVHSHFSPLKEEGPFEISLQTRKEQSEEALA